VKTCILLFGRIFCGCAAKNRAIRSNSSESAFGAFLRDFHFYPLRAHQRSGSSKPGPGIAVRQFPARRRLCLRRVRSKAPALQLQRQLENQATHIIASAHNLCIRQGLFWASCPGSPIIKNTLPRAFIWAWQVCARNQTEAILEKLRTLSPCIAHNALCTSLSLLAAERQLRNRP
jgi:hypothetical protein